MELATRTIRNVAIVGHGQTGKTTLFEQLLFTAGVIAKTETSASGKSVSDYTPEEVEHAISIYASLAHLNYKEKLINIWDTPGSSDFVGEVISALRSSEMALMLVDGRSGVQIETVKLWRDLDRRNKPRFVYINRTNDERTDVSAISKDIHQKFNCEVCPVTIPMGTGAQFEGVIDVLRGKAFFTPQNGAKEEESAIPEKYLQAYENARGVLAGAAAEGDDDLLVKFIDEGELSSEEIVRGLSVAFKSNRIVPIFCGSTSDNVGMQSILDFITDIAPSPEQCIETAKSANDEDATVKIDENEPFSALVVKTASDQFSGRLSYLKIVTGTLTSECEVYNVGEARKEKIGKLYRCTGKKLEETKKLVAGDIGIATKLAITKTSDTLASSADFARFIKLRHPNPVFAMAISAKEKKDEDRISELVARYAEEDRTLLYTYNAETKQNVLSGMGELHIGILLNKVQAQTKTVIQTTVPRIAYRETIARKAQAEYTHKKQSGGHGQYGRVVLAIEALERGENFAFTNAVFGGAISKGYIPGIEKGVKEAMEHGVLAGYPVVDVAVTVLDGKEHPVDSSEMAFKIASRNAFKDAMRNAGAILLEPIMNVTVLVESKYLGDIMSDISSKRGRILGQTPIGGGIEEIRAQVPESELLRYAIDLRSITSGTGSFETSFAHYDAISGKIADDVIRAAKEFMQDTHTDD